MQKVVIKTATEARNEFFDLIAAAKYGGQVTVVTKNGGVVAQVGPVTDQGKITSWKKLDEAMEAVAGIFTDEDVRQYRKLRLSLNKPRFPEW